MGFRCRHSRRRMASDPARKKAQSRPKAGRPQTPFTMNKPRMVEMSAEEYDRATSLLANALRASSDAADQPVDVTA